MLAQETRSADPKVHTAAVRVEMKKLIDHLRRDINQVTEPRAQAMFETTAEVLLGLVKTLDDYDVGKERAFHA